LARHLIEIAISMPVTPTYRPAAAPYDLRTRTYMRRSSRTPTNVRQTDRHRRWPTAIRSDPGGPRQRQRVNVQTLSWTQHL